MNNSKKVQRILWYEAAGFLFLIALSWLDELISLPHLLFGGGEHSNWHEAVLETVALVLVWFVVFSFTRRLLARFYYLEGFLQMCAWCRKLSHDDKWYKVEDYFVQSFAIKTSHGMCPECQEKWKEESAKVAA